VKGGLWLGLFQGVWRIQGRPKFVRIITTCGRDGEGAASTDLPKTSIAVQTLWAATEGGSGR